MRVLAALVLFSLPAVAWADPCEGRLPRPGERFAGVVRYVGDGDSLCIGPRGRPDRWIEVRLADFRAPELSQPGGRESRRQLERVAHGRRLECLARNRTYDRVAAWCRLDGRPLGDTLRRVGGREGGR